MLQVNSFNLFEVLTNVFLWTTLYFSLCLWNSARSYEWHCRIVTTVHAVVISVMAIYYTFRVGPSPFTDAGGPNSPAQVRIVSLCLGYFIFDVIWCLYFRTEGPAMMAHHFVSIVGMFWCLLTGYYGTELVATIGGAEVTNPLLQLRWFLRETGHYRTLLGDVVDWAFMISFGLMRLGFGTKLLVAYLMQDTNFWGRLGGICIYSIGWIFFINIISYAIHKYSKRRKERLEKQQFSPCTENSATNCKDFNLKQDVCVITDQDIPSPREIKYGDKELTLRRNCLVQESLQS